MLNAGGTQTGWRLTTAGDTVESYALDGKLTAVTTRAGLKTTLAYNAKSQLTTVTGPFGDKLTFTLDAKGRVATMKEPDGGVFKYAYDASNNLASVTHPDGGIRKYVYGNAAFPHALTGITDENGQSYASWTYDTLGRAVTSQHAGGAELTTVAYNADGTSTVTDARGNAHAYALTTQFDMVKPTAVTGAPYPAAGGKAFAYDDNGFVASRTDFDGNVTTYAHDARGNETSRTEAAGTALARTISTAWLPNFHLPAKITEPGRVTSFSYDAHGNLLKKTVAAGSLTRSWAYTYNGARPGADRDRPARPCHDLHLRREGQSGDGQGRARPCHQIHRLRRRRAADRALPTRTGWRPSSPIISAGSRPRAMSAARSRITPTTAPGN